MDTAEDTTIEYGSGSISVGYITTDSILAQHDNIAIGSGAGVTGKASYSIALGVGALCDATHSIVFGHNARTTACLRCGRKDHLIVLGKVCVCDTCFERTLRPDPFTCYVCLKSKRAVEGVGMPELSGKRLMGLCHSCMRNQAIAHYAREQSAKHMQALGVKSVEARLAALERRLVEHSQPMS